MKSGLGKGLGALITNQNDGDNNQIEIKINDIEPNSLQPRKVFDIDKLNELAESIRVHGIIQPIVVRKRHEKYEIIAGERRWRGARIAGLIKVPVVVKDFNDEEAMEAALIENLQREDLNPIEEANGYESLIKNYNLTQEEISKVIGKSRSAIANTIRLLSLDERVKDMLSDNRLTSGHARTLVTVDDKEMQYELAKKICDNSLSVRETESLLKGMNNKKTPSKKEKNPIIMEIEDSLKEILGTRVKILSNKNKGKIEIEYYSNDDLERILNILQK